MQHAHSCSHGPYLTYYSGNKITFWGCKDDLKLQTFEISCICLSQGRDSNETLNHIYHLLPSLDLVSRLVQNVNGVTRSWCVTVLSFCNLICTHPVSFALIFCYLFIGVCLFTLLFETQPNLDLDLIKHFA